MWDVIIIGAGVIGASIAREISRYELKTLVIEKEEDVCEVTSMANSGIVHSGYDPKPGSLKAKLNVIGNGLFDKLSMELGFDFKRIGSITIGKTEEDLATLKRLQKNGIENGVKTIILDKEELFLLEPNLALDAKYGLLAESAGIVNPFEYTVALMENAIFNGVKLNLEEEVLKISKLENTYKIITNKNEYITKIVINAAGLNSGDVAGMVGSNIDIRPRKGEYFVLNHLNKPLISHVIFPLPSEKGKGILLTPTTSNNYLIGPSSEYVSSLDDFSTDTLTLEKVRSDANNLVKDIPFNEVIRTFAGLRAVNSKRDFIIEEDKTNPNFYQVAGIESPGLASSYAIALYLIDIIKKKNNLITKKDFVPYRKPYIKLKGLPLEEKQKIYEKNPKYGRIICRCEQISEAEILDVIHREIPVKTIRGVKKRIRPGFGKCQGGFCESLVFELLKNEFDLDPLKIKYGRKNSEVIKKITKEGQNEKL